ncbi:MAG: NAD-dependent epimerase/dehydratase family protein [Chloroflexi bacterium]|nr:NAD-dependent epimerase/dehydratase family protein [Chloroflexota bacterium]
MRVLITGVSGFVGSWLSHELVGRGHVLTGYDIRRKPGLPVAQWHEGDVLDLDRLTQAARGCDALVHLAVLPLHRSRDEPLADLQVNAGGTLQALRAARRAGVGRFLLVSSSAVYGALSGRLSEEMTLRPISPYGVSKAAGEAYARMFARVHDLQTAIVRVFQVYGRSREGELRITVEGRFIRAVLEKRAPTIYGDPERGYDFIHIADVARGLALALESDLPAGIALNLGTGQPTKLAQLARWCIDAAGLDMEPDMLEGPPAAPTQYADLTRTRRFLPSFRAQRDLRAWVEAAIAQEQASRKGE